MEVYKNGPSRILEKNELEVGFFLMSRKFPPVKNSMLGEKKIEPKNSHKTWSQALSFINE